MSLFSRSFGRLLHAREQEARRQLQVYLRTADRDLLALALDLSLAGRADHHRQERHHQKLDRTADRDQRRDPAEGRRRADKHRLEPAQSEGEEHHHQRGRGG